MSRKYRAVASFDDRGRLIASSQDFRSEVPLSAELQIGKAVRAMLESEGDEERWVLVGQTRVLLQALHGHRPGCLALVHEAAKTKTPGRKQLSPRQLEIAEYAAAGASAPEISRLLKISVHTVRQHLKETYRRLRVGNRIELRHELDQYARRISTIRPLYAKDDGYVKDGTD